MNNPRGLIYWETPTNQSSKEDFNIITVWMEVNNGNESNNIEKKLNIQKEEFNIKESQCYNILVFNEPSSGLGKDDIKWY